MLVVARRIFRKVIQSVDVSSDRVIDKFDCWILCIDAWNGMMKGGGGATFGGDSNDERLPLWRHFRWYMRKKERQRQVEDTKEQGGFF